MENLDQMRKGTTTLAILKLLIDSGEPMHGYQIARALELRSQGSFQFKEGLIYPRLHQMERDGLVRSEWEGKRGTRRRKVYVPTAEGKRRLAAELEQWQAFSLSMERLLGLSE
ncbi:MAG: helix-turn-helix transcriptional regulator [Chloroflexi bacterium]|nr:helix-turn-helix transcriptional regulator [Chloroflexota bacterium]